MTRILCPPIVLEIPGPRPMSEVTCWRVCARGTAEGNGSVNGTPRFTPPAWVRIDADVQLCLFSRLSLACEERNAYQRHMLWGERDKKCQVSKWWSEKDGACNSWSWPHETEGKNGMREHGIVDGDINGWTLVWKVMTGRESETGSVWF